MVFDISKLTDYELNELRKAVLKESVNRGNKLKSDSQVYGKLIDCGIKKQLEKDGLDDDQKHEASRVLSYFEKAVFKICDITIGNYKITPVPGTGNNGNRLVCNGADLRDEYYDDFLAMSNEIMDIVKKYFDKSQEYRNKEEN